MRAAVLTGALMMVAALAWADGPGGWDAETEATAETSPAKSDEAAASDTTTAVAPERDKIPLRPPAGYKPRRINGEQVWCAKLVVLGSKFPKVDCRNEAQLRELIRIRESMRTDMEMRTRTCTSDNGACGFK
jgi:hypothetical protein